MITRVEISGFKSFTDFAVDLAPLSVIAGANASGKSNFLDALRVIQGLATGRKFAEILDKRGQARDLFTKYTANEKAREIRIAIELLTPPFYEGRADKVKLKGTRFRYEIVLDDRGTNEDYFELYEENLTYIAKEDDVWAKPYLKQQGLILLYPEEGSSDLINRGNEGLVRDEEGKLKFSNIGDRYEQTFLSIANGDEDIHLLAVRQVFENLFALDLASPENFSNDSNRKSSNNIILKELKELATKQPEDFSSVNFQRSEGINYLSLRVRQIAKNIIKVNAWIDPFGRLSIFAENQEGARFLSDSLSEGTLRAIALSSLLVSKAKQRTYLFEEPENGVDPRVLKKMVQLLMDIATDFSEEDLPHNQIICTTHSPILLDLIVNAPENRHAIAYLTSATNKVVEKGAEKFLTPATRIQPIMREINAPVEDSRLERVTLHQAKAYMEHGRLNSLPDA